MKKSLLIGTTVLALALSATSIYAQVVSGTSIVDKMKAVAHTFTLSTELNAGQTGLTSEPVKGKKTGDILTAGEWNRMLEIVSQGGTGGSGGSGWENVLLTDTTPFDKACEYRFIVNTNGDNASIGGTNPVFYAAAVDPFAITYVSHSSVITHILASSKNVFRNSGTPVYTVTKMEKLCGGGGGTTTVTGGSPALYKCTNAQSADATNAPCYGASRNGGAGTNQYRVISCTDNDGIRSYTMSSILNFGQLATNKWAVSVNGGTIECDDGTVLVIDTTGNSSSTSGMSAPIVKTKFKPTTSSSLTFDIPAGSRYATAKIFGNATGYGAIGNDENHEAMEIFFDFQNGKSSGIHNLVIGVGVNWSYGYTWEDHAFGTRVVLKNGDDTLPAGYEIWANGVRPTVNVTGSQLSISGLSNDYISQTWMVTFY